jgi:hypothetical protein
MYFNYTHDGPGLQINNTDGPGVQDTEGTDDTDNTNDVQKLGAGIVSNIHVHVHQTMFDSLLIFRESNRQNTVFAAIDPIRPKDQYLPYIPECHNDTLERTKGRLMELALGPRKAQLLCEATKPGLVWTKTPTANCASSSGASGVGADKDASASTDHYGYHGRLIDLHCLENIRLEAGDALTIVAFNKAPATSTAGKFTRSENGWKGPGVYENGEFA